MPGPSQDEQLVAQIIPLRQRAAGPLRVVPADVAVEQQPQSSGTTAAERSAWEPPTAGQLRRRSDSRGLLGRAAVALRLRVLLLGTAGLAVCAAAAALALAAIPAGPVAHTSSRGQVLAAGSDLPASSARTHEAALTRRREATGGTIHRRARQASTHTAASSPTHHAGSAAHASSPHVSPPAGKAAADGSGGAYKAPSSQAQTGALQPSGSGHGGGDAASPPVRPASANTATSSAQSECVPGELGC